MRVLFVTRHYFPHIGGIEQSINKLGTLFAVHHEVTVLTVARDGLPATERIDGALVRRVSTRDFASFDLTQYDVVLIENFELTPHLFVIANILRDRLLGRRTYKLLFVPHGGFTPYWHMFSPPARLLKYCVHRLVGVPFINSSVDCVVAVSRWELDALVTAGLRQSTVLISNGFELGMRRDFSRERAFIIVGRIDRIKNLEGALRLLAQIRRDEGFHGWRLKIIGDDIIDKPYVSSLHALASTLDLAEAVTFLGRRIGDEKLTMIGCASALICFSHFETDSIVVKEALSMGTKVIIAPRAGLSDYVGVTNVFTDTRVDTERLAQFIAAPFVPLPADDNSWERRAQQYEALFR